MQLEVDVNSAKSSLFIEILDILKKDNMIYDYRVTTANTFYDNIFHESNFCETSGYQNSSINTKKALDFIEKFGHRYRNTIDKIRSACLTYRIPNTEHPDANFTLDEGVLFTILLYIYINFPSVRNKFNKGLALDYLNKNENTVKIELDESSEVVEFTFDDYGMHFIFTLYKLEADEKPSTDKLNNHDNLLNFLDSFLNHDLDYLKIVEENHERLMAKL